MSIQLDHDLLRTLRYMRDKIDLDSSPRTPTLDNLYGLLLRRIATLEAAQTVTHRGGDRDL